jgi:hypothetical protein
MRGLTDRELGQLDVPALIRSGLVDGSPARTALFGDGTVAAAIAADRLSTRPRSLVFLAEVVRRGGIAYAAGLPEPLPGPARAALARDWLSAASTAAAAAPASTAAAADAADERFARWLVGVAVVLGARQRSGPPPEG